MKIRGKKEETKKMCPHCKADLETIRTDAFGSRFKTHFYVVEECHVCGGYRGRGRLEIKSN
jgi:uncharacterized protein with PIN domain